LTLFPEEDNLSREVESWRGFAECLPSNDKEGFLKMLKKLHNYSMAINTKVKPFPSEPVIMALLLEQHKLIRWLKSRFDDGRERNDRNKNEVLQMQ